MRESGQTEEQSSRWPLPLNAARYIAEELGEGKRPKIKPNLGAGIEWEKSANKTKFVPRKLGSGWAEVESGVGGGA